MFQNCKSIDFKLDVGDNVLGAKNLPSLVLIGIGIGKRPQYPVNGVQLKKSCNWTLIRNWSQTFGIRHKIVEQSDPDPPSREIATMSSSVWKQTSISWKWCVIKQSYNLSEPFSKNAMCGTLLRINRWPSQKQCLKEQGTTYFCCKRLSCSECQAHRTSRF